MYKNNSIEKVSRKKPNHTEIVFNKGRQREMCADGLFISALTIESSK